MYDFQTMAAAQSFSSAAGEKSENHQRGTSISCEKTKCRSNWKWPNQSHRFCWSGASSYRAARRPNAIFIHRTHTQYGLPSHAHRAVIDLLIGMRWTLLEQLSLTWKIYRWKFLKYILKQYCASDQVVGVHLCCYASTSLNRTKRSKRTRWHRVPFLLDTRKTRKSSRVCCDRVDISTCDATQRADGNLWYHLSKTQHMNIVAEMCWRLQDECLTPGLLVSRWMQYSSMDTMKAMNPVWKDGRKVSDINTGSYGIFIVFWSFDPVASSFVLRQMSSGKVSVNLLEWRWTYFRARAKEPTTRRYNHCVLIGDFPNLF